jgi:hypothetical protein
MFRIGEELGSLNSTLRFASENQAKMVEHRINRSNLKDSITNAQVLLQQVEGGEGNCIDNEFLIAMIDLFEAEPRKADTYMSLQTDDLRKDWVRHQLKKMNYVLPDSV